MTPNFLLLSIFVACPFVYAENFEEKAKQDRLDQALQEVHNLCAERTRLRIHHRKEHPRFEEIENRIVEIHEDELSELQTVAKNAYLDCSEEPRYGQPSYGVILSANCIDDIALDELLLFHAGRVYRTSGSFSKLETTGAGWYFRPSTKILAGSRFVVACIQDSPEEIENVKNGFMPNSDRARNPDRPYRTEIYHPDGKRMNPIR